MFKKMSLIIGGSLLGLALAGCGGGGERALRVGVIRPSLNHLPLVLADMTAFEVVEFASGWEANEALAAGRVDAAILPFTYVWSDAAQGLPVRTVSFLERESDGLAAARSLTSVADLAGKRVGVLRASTLDVLASHALARAGVEAELVPLRGPSELAAALRRGDVDAISFYVPPILDLGDDFAVLHWFGDDDPGHPCCNVAAHTDALRDRAPQVRALLAALERGIEILATRRGEAIDAAAGRWRLSPAQADSALARMDFRLGLDDAGRAFEARLADIMLARGYLSRPVAAGEVYAEQNPR